MNPPTPRALSAWWTAQPDGLYTCTDCGRLVELATACKVTP